VRKASLLARRNDRAGEARELAEAERVRRETAFDYFLSGQQEYKRHRWPDASQDFEIALRKKPDYFWAQCMLANCYLRTSRAEAAKSCLNSCVQTDPEPALLYLLRGFASGQIGVKYLSLVKSNPGQDSALNASAAFEFEEAEADFQEALARLERSPDDELHYEVLVNRAYFRVQRGRLDQAAADYQAAIRLKEDLFLAHADLALVYQKQEKPAEAIEQLTRAIALKPDQAALYRGRAGLLKNFSDSTSAQREAARADLEMAIRYEQPDNPVLAQDHTNRGKMLYLDERLEDALEESQLAVRVVPNYEDAHVLRIQVLLKLRRYDEAIRSCDVVLATGKKSAFLYQLRGEAHAAHHNYPEAIRDYGRALELHPDDRGLLIRRGWAYLVFDSPRLALGDFDAAIKLDPANCDAYNGRGTAHVRLGDHRLAVADAREALRLTKANPRVTYNAARIYALAASITAAEVGEMGRQARLLSSEYQDTALQLIRKALEQEAPEKRAGFWRDTIQPDPALKAIRRRLKFEDLIATTNQPHS
jgi:tetratricopeptide (TPR) repeat protein